MVRSLRGLPYNATIRACQDENDVTEFTYLGVDPKTIEATIGDKSTIRSMRDNAIGGPLYDSVPSGLSSSLVPMASHREAWFSTPSVDSHLETGPLSLKSSQRTCDREDSFRDALARKADSFGYAAR